MIKNVEIDGEMIQAKYYRKDNIFNALSGLWAKISMSFYKSYYIKRECEALNDYKSVLRNYRNDINSEEWDKIVNDMAKNLYYTNEENIKRELKRSVSSGWIPSCETVNEIKTKHRDGYLKLFNEYL